MTYPAVRQCVPPAHSPDSYRNMASGDRIAVEVAATEDFGDQTWEPSYSLDCHVQQQYSVSDTSFRSRGQGTRYILFFACDPGITTDNRILWTHRGGCELAEPKVLQVVSHDSFARPGEQPFQWTVDCELLSTRREVFEAE